MGLIKPKSGGIDTSDATATPEYVLKNETFYANGEKKTGTLEMMRDGYTVEPNNGIDVIKRDNENWLRLKHEFQSNYYASGSYGIYIIMELYLLGNATAADVLKGKTFTSSAGLKIAGTLEPLDLKTLTGYDHASVDIIEYTNSTNFMDGLPLTHSLGMTPEKFILFPVANYGYGSGITHCIYQTKPIAGSLQGYVAGYSIADSAFKITDITGHITMTDTQIQTDITVGTLSPQRYLLITLANDVEMISVTLEYYDATNDKKAYYDVKYYDGDTWADACKNGQNDLIYNDNGSMYFAGDGGAQRILYSDLGLYLTDDLTISSETRYATEEVFDM